MRGFFFNLGCMNPDSDFLARLCSLYYEKYRENLQVFQTKPLGGGCISKAFCLETNKGLLFLKFNTQGPADLFTREADSLEALKNSKNPILVFPEVLLATEAGPAPAFLLTTFLEADPGKQADEQLGRGLAMLHACTDERFGFHCNNYCGATLQVNQFHDQWVSFYADNRLLHLLRLIKVHREWNAPDQKIFDQFIARLPALLDHQPMPSLIHGDLWSGNLMITTRGPALIDPCASYCDREMELGMMTLFGGFSSRVYAAYHEQYPLPQGWRERNELYQLYHVLNHYLLFGGFYKNQALSIMKKY